MYNLAKTLQACYLYEVPPYFVNCYTANLSQLRAMLKCWWSETALQHQVIITWWKRYTWRSGLPTLPSQPSQASWEIPLLPRSSFESCKANNQPDEEILRSQLLVRQSVQDGIITESTRRLERERRGRHCGQLKYGAEKEQKRWKAFAISSHPLSCVESWTIVKLNRS